MSGRGRDGLPLYVRALRLKRIRPGGVMCFLFFEGVIALAVLLSLAELVNWWAVLVLPVTVAGLVKINDIVTDAFSRSDITMRFTTRKQLGEARGTAVVPSARRQREPAIDDPTEVLPRALRRRATNQRLFVSATESRPVDRDKKTY